MNLRGASGFGLGVVVSVGFAQPAKDAAARVPAFKKSRRSSRWESFLSGVVEFRVEVATKMRRIFWSAMGQRRPGEPGNTLFVLFHPVPPVPPVPSFLMPEITTRLSTALADRYRIECEIGKAG